MLKATILGSLAAAGCSGEKPPVNGPRPTGPADWNALARGLDGTLKRGGGGGNFGVAVSFTYRTHEAGDVTPFSLRRPWPDAAQVLRGWQRWAPAAPEEVWTSLHLDTDPGAATPAVEVIGVALADADGHMNRLTAAVGTDPAASSAQTRPYLDAMKFMGGCAGQTVEQCHAQGTLPGRRPGGDFPRTDYAGKSHIPYEENWKASLPHFKVFFRTFRNTASPSKTPRTGSAP